ncbi:HYC_CC_PP family protein [Mucilaginibacter myungsuensis]|uniref:Uncharacterized protein n=1 Tax=Mucilaginibacter myungsuensis TaxID=649104 RepID=A0A929KTK1_9SPHI|nr:hypothetical protein [Mucilaginibacter myungsuensis]MBE9661316.1 hypothetical protein [Mucilaginibacter myungsuensis]MDN3597459.1 hypothetical protein [Mucilaginibacter myungsuensis]
MIKRISVLAILLLYFGTSTGFALNLHYCGKMLASVKINAPSKKCGPVKMKCCHDKSVEVKVKDAHKASAESSKNADPVVFDLPKFLYQNFIAPLKTFDQPAQPKRGPPDALCAVPVYIKNCTYRI